MACCKIINRYLKSEYAFRLCIFSIAKVTEVKHFSDKLLKRVLQSQNMNSKIMIPKKDHKSIFL